jgi:hypothetical protein
MIILAFAIVLLLTGSGEAWEHPDWSMDIVPGNWFGIVTEQEGPIATCDLNYANCEMHKPEAFPCYQRMQEAMRESDLYINQKAGIVHYDKDGKMYAMPDPNFVKDWNQVMRDCVKETP